MVIYTTSRYASKESIGVAKKKAAGAFYINRGKKTVETLVQIARKKGERWIAILEETKDNYAPGFSFVEVFHNGSWKWVDRIDSDEGKWED